MQNASKLATLRQYAVKTGDPLLWKSGQAKQDVGGLDRLTELFIEQVSLTGSLAMPILLHIDLYNNGKIHSVGLKPRSFLADGIHILLLSKPQKPSQNTDPEMILLCLINHLRTKINRSYI